MQSTSQTKKALVAFLSSLAICAASLSPAAADDRPTPGDGRSVGVPLRARQVPLNASIYLVMRADPAKVAAVWPEVPPGNAPPGTAIIALRDPEGNLVDTEISAVSILGGAAVTVTPKTPLRPSTMYEIRAAVAEAVESQGTSNNVQMIHRVEGRFVTATSIDETAPVWEGPVVATLDTFRSDSARGGCSSYLERLTIGHRDVAEEGTDPVDLRMVVAAPQQAEGASALPVVLFGKPAGSYTISNCNGSLFGWSADAEANPGATERVLRVVLQDVAGNESQAYEVRFPAETSQSDWTSEGTVAPVADVVEVAEVGDEAEAEEGAEVTEGGESSPVVWIILGLLVLAGIAVLVRSKKS